MIKIPAVFDRYNRKKDRSYSLTFISGLGKDGKSPAFGSVVMKIQDSWEIQLITK